PRFSLASAAAGWAQGERWQEDPALAWMWRKARRRRLPGFRQCARIESEAPECPPIRFSLFQVELPGQDGRGYPVVLYLVSCSAKPFWRASSPARRKAAW